MRISFDLLPVDTSNDRVYRPIITLQIQHEGKTRLFEFLVDSGADHSILGKEYAEELGMNFSEGRKAKIRGIATQAINCIEKKVLMNIPEFNEWFESKVFISKDIQLQHNILGRDNFFIKYRVGID